MRTALSERAEVTKMIVELVLATLYFIALINPISKVSVLAVLSPDSERSGLMLVAKKASLVAGGILVGSMLFGNFVLSSVFHVELHSLRLAGGIVLCWVGFNALRKGVFFEQDMRAKFEDITLVPLACPMIAGPATIAACMSVRAEDGLLVPVLAIVLAVGINHVIMTFSRQIGNVLGRFNLLGAIVRLTGLIVMSMGTQMALDGVSSWLSRLP